MNITQEVPEAVSEQQKNLEYQVAVSQLDTKIKQTSPRLHHHVLLVISLLIFPPVAFYLMWKYKEYHSLFATLSWISGGLLLLFTIVLNFGILPQIQNVISTFGNGGKVTLGGPIVFLLIFLAIVQLGLGFYLKRVYKQRGDLTKVEIVITIVVFALGYLLPGFLYGNIITPIYNSILP